MGAPPVLLSFLLALAPLAAETAPPDPWAARSRTGKDLMAAGRYAEAVPVYRELTRALPKNAGLYLNLGMALHLSGDDRAAVPALQAALRLQPDLAPASLFLGAAHLGLGRPDQARRPLEAAVRAQPDDPGSRSLLAQALLALERYAEAEPHLRRLTALAPTDPGAWFSLGRTYEELVRERFERLVELDPESGYVLALAADGRMKDRQRTAAFHLYREALARRPGLRGLHAALAEIYRQAGHPEWAAVEEERERRLRAPDCARETLECAFAAGRHAQVIAEAARNPGDPSSTYWTVRAYDRLAAAAFDRLAGLPPSPELHEWRAQALREERRFAESAEEWRKAATLSQDDPRLRMERAIALRLNQDFAEAERVLGALLRADPQAPELNSLMGDVLLAQQKAEAALPFLETAVRGGSPPPPQDHGALGRAYALVGRSADAIPHLEKALREDADGSLHLQLGRAYQAAGRPEDARRTLGEYEEIRAARREEPSAPSAALPPPEAVAPSSR